MSKWQPAIAGDTLDTRVIQLNGIATNLDNVVTVRATVRHTTTDEVAVLAAAVSDSAAFEVTVQLGTWLADGPTLGTWECQIETTWVSGAILTHPTPAVPDTILVAADHD